MKIERSYSASIIMKNVYPRANSKSKWRQKSWIFCSFFLALCYLYWLRKNCIFKYFGWSRRLSKNTFAFRDFLKLIDCDLWQSRNRIPSKCLLHSGDQSYIFHSVNNHKLSKSKISCIYFSFKNYYSIKFVTTNVTFSCIVSQITWK